MTLPFRRALLAASVLALTAPASALANVTIEREGTTISVFTPAGNGGQGEVSVYKDGTTLLVQTEDYGTVTAAGGCELAYADVYDCGVGAVSSIDVDLSSANRAYVSLGAGIVPDNGTVSVKGGAVDGNILGADDDATYDVTYTGGAGDDFANPGAGDDTFFGLGGADTFRPSEGNDTFNGGDGDDVAETGPGDDRFNGDAGNDTLETGDAADGSDTFIGGSDSGDADDSRYWGDAVVYYDRSTPITVALGNGGPSEPTVGNGAAGENDKFAQVESVEGGTGVNTLTGNDSANELFGGSAADTLDGAGGNDWIAGYQGADSLSGGTGDDFIQARRDVFENVTDVDASLSCGDGTDRIVRDQNDPAAADCELDTPGFVKPEATLTGNLNVGSVLTVTGLETFGGAGNTSTNFVSCTDVEYTDCKDLAIGGASYTLTDAELGRFIYAVSYVQDSGGYGDRTGTPLSGQVGARLPVAAVPTPTPAPTPVVVPPSFETVSQGAASKALGAGATLVPGLKLGDGVAAFTPKDVKKNTLPLGSKPAPVLAIVCKTSCVVEGKTEITFTAKGKKKTIKLKSQKSTVAGGTAAVITVKTSSAQRKAIKAAKNAKVKVSLTVTQGGKKTKGSTSLKLKVKP